jgi:hypothetical protein
MALCGGALSASHHYFKVEDKPTFLVTHIYLVHELVLADEITGNRNSHKAREVLSPKFRPIDLTTSFAV